MSSQSNETQSNETQSNENRMPLADLGNNDSVIQPLINAMAKKNPDADAIDRAIKDIIADTPTPYDGSSALHETAAINTPEAARALRVLIETGGLDVNDISSEQCETPLHIAATCGNLHAIDVLIETAADINAKSSQDNTPLHYAIAYKNTDAATMLIDKGADINATNRDGYTPLHLAARYGNAEIARLLMDKGADVNAKDVEGKTPAEHAKASGKAEVAALLITPATNQITDSALAPSHVDRLLERGTRNDHQGIPGVSELLKKTITDKPIQPANFAKRIQRDKQPPAGRE